MCTDTIPIRNTLYGYIISPAYPHPMADNFNMFNDYWYESFLRIFRRLVF